jgi:hypothetical protein
VEKKKQVATATGLFLLVALVLLSGRQYRTAHQLHAFTRLLGSSLLEREGRYVL